tara:strand:+ start:205 stop:387 length:183 start_codon:yes stop_codon:yes gene_type:complete
MEQPKPIEEIKDIIVTMKEDVEEMKDDVAYIKSVLKEFVKELNQPREDGDAIISRGWFEW